MCMWIGATLSSWNNTYIPGIIAWRKRGCCSVKIPTAFEQWKEKIQMMVPIWPWPVWNRARTTSSVTFTEISSSAHVYRLLGSKKMNFLLGFSELSNFRLEKYFYQTKRDMWRLKINGQVNGCGGIHIGWKETRLKWIGYGSDLYKRKCHLIHCTNKHIFW